MRGLDLTSWQGLLLTTLGLLLATILGVGIRLILMLTLQARRERMNRQINERLRVLIGAYKVLGGSFTGDLSVDPAHLRDLRRRPDPDADGGGVPGLPLEGSDRARRIRDAVEAALSDVLLLGTEEHVRLAERAARELVAGRRVHLHDLVASLRGSIREALDLDPLPAGLAIPPQGPTRPSGGGAGKGDRAEGGRGGGGGGGQGGGGGLALAGGGGVGLGAGLAEAPAEPPTDAADAAAAGGPRA